MSASKRGRASREKGKRGEREAAKAVAETLGCTARRGVQFHGGEDSPDIQTSIAGVHFEVKRVERIQIEQWMQQATEDARGNCPVVLHRRNGKEWLITLRLQDARRFIDAVDATAAQEAAEVVR